MTEKRVAEILVNIGVLRGIDGATCRNDTNSATIGIQNRLLRCTAFAGIEMSKTACSEHPKRLVLVGHLAYAAQIHHTLVGDGVVAAVTGIVHIQRTILQKVVELVLCQRVALARCIGLLWVGIEIDLIDDEIGVLAAHTLGSCLCHTGMQIVVTIIGKENKLLFPFARVGVFDISNQLIHHLLRLRFGGDGKTPDTNIHATLRVAFALVVVEESKIVVGGVSLGLDGGVLRLVGEQRVLARCGQQLAVVESAVTHQTEPTRLAVAACATVVEHFHQPTIRRGIGGTAGELVIDLLIGNNRPCDGLFLLVRLCEPSSLGDQKIGADDNIVDISKCVQVLVANAANNGRRKPTAAIGIDGDVFLYLALVAALKGKR